MAGLPSPTQVAGSHYHVYEAYYYQIDPNNLGSVGAIEAARFLKKSGLSDAILSKIWDLSDPNGKGYLNKVGLFVALKLVSLAQSGCDVSMANIVIDIAPPKMGDYPIPVVPTINSVPATLSDWAMKPSERSKYDQLFDTLQPLNGVIPGNKVKGLLIDSKLPVDTLGKIWDLADMDKDGSLNRHEFVVAMHLVYKALEKYAIPNSLPPELLPAGKRKDSQMSTAAPVASMLIIQPEPFVQVGAPILDWVVSSEEKSRYDVLFQQTDIDKDGFVSGHEIRDVFLKSGVPQLALAHIWGLCDTKQTGKLNGEQFALAMWLINQKLKGIEPPQQLIPEMVPPSSRHSTTTTTENNNAPYTNPELDMFSKDIEELVKEKQILEGEIMQREADIKIKTGEVKSLQGELDTLSATLKQLESQKREAQKRLNDLRNQTVLVESELSDVKMELEAELAQVCNLRQQAEEQEAAVKVQEAEVCTKKEELEGLRIEEATLEQTQRQLTARLDSLGTSLQDYQLQISQVKAKRSQVEEHQRQMCDAIAASEIALSSGDVTLITDSMLCIEPEFMDPAVTRLLNGKVSGNDPFSRLNGPADSGGDDFQHNDAFHGDPFKRPTNPTSDPFTTTDGFESAFSSKALDSFSGADPFGNVPVKSDPFDPFGDSRHRGGAKSDDEQHGGVDKDAFGCDPFAVLHAPTRSESPSPALPPKKSKTPPPRPAPPRPASQPPPPTTAFADFANFNSKCCHMSKLPMVPLQSGSISFSQTGSTAQIIISFPNRSWSNILKQFSDTASPAPVVASVTVTDFTEDPFRDYRYEDPFSFEDPFDEEQSPISATTRDPFSPNRLIAVNGTAPATVLPTEDQQLAWAASESLRLEEERKRETDKEEAELKLVMKLSKKEKNKATSTLKKILS